MSGDGRIAVMTTPLPALGPRTRSWNDLFGGADAWPAFLMVRSLAAWLADLDSRQPTILVGQSTVLHPEIRPAGPTGGRPETTDRPESESVAESVGVSGESNLTMQWYPPDSRPPRTITIDDADRTDATSTDATSTDANALRMGGGSESPADGAGDGGEAGAGSGPAVVIRDAESPGTYFLRGPGVWTGMSANLPEIWSSDQTAGTSTLSRWFGATDWSITRQRSSLELSGGDGGPRAVSLHGPLTLLVVIAFLAEQLLSNRFYGASSARSGATSRTLARSAEAV